MKTKRLPLALLVLLVHVALTSGLWAWGPQAASAIDAGAGRWLQVVTVTVVPLPAPPWARAGDVAKAQHATPLPRTRAAAVVPGTPVQPAADTATPAPLPDVAGVGANTAAPAAEPAVPPPAQHEAEPSSPRAPGIILARADHQHCPPVPFPPALRERGIEGQVHLLVRVSAQGLPAEVRVINASGWRLFDEAAVLRARNCRFVPERRGGDAVESWVDFPVRFALNG